MVVLLPEQAAARTEEMLAMVLAAPPDLHLVEAANQTADSHVSQDALVAQVAQVAQVR